MEKARAVHAYFDAKAPDYDRLSGRGLWARVRASEAKAVERLLGPVAGEAVLDLGCGSGFYSRRMRERGATVLGVDSSPAMIRELKKKAIAGECADIAGLRLGREFRVVLAAGLVEFLGDELDLFSAAHRHCEAGGRLVVLAPRAGLAGWIYETCHTWMGCRAKARSVEALREAASVAGWDLEKVLGAGPVSLAFRFTRL